jgi:hypothetical protein
MTLAKKYLSPSALAYRPGESIPETQNVRTSSGTFLSSQMDPGGVLAWLEDRIAGVTHLPAENGEVRAWRTRTPYLGAVLCEHVGRRWCWAERQCWLYVMRVSNRTEQCTLSMLQGGTTCPRDLLSALSVIETLRTCFQAFNCLRYMPTQHYDSHYDSFAVSHESQAFHCLCPMEAIAW